jgi:RNase P/RNase MRP subunit POP5
MKALKPSMREKKRYLLLRGKDLKKNVNSSIRDFIGILGLSEASPSWINSEVLCVNRGSLDKVRACFAVWPEKIEVIRVSGTLKGLKAKKLKKV